MYVSLHPIYMSCIYLYTENAHPSSPSTKKRHQTRSHQHAHKDIGQFAIARLHGSRVEQDLMREQLHQTWHLVSFTLRDACRGRGTHRCRAGYLLMWHRGHR